ncbi:MAG: efflux transporter periplasmic adaptor subunit, partial [Maribacter sp.]|nr:efflux transporter periplasmic adaptor subunit [Maribacter sp.]
MYRFIGNIFLSMIFVAVSSCGNGNNANQNDPDASTADDARIIVTQAQFDQNAMQMGSLQEITFPLTVHANGMIDVPPENRAVVSAIMGGYIK